MNRRTNRIIQFTRTLRFRLILLLLIPMFFFVLTAFMQLNTISSNMDKMDRILFEGTYQTNDLTVQADRDAYEAMSKYNMLRFAELNQEQHDQIAKEFEESAHWVDSRITRLTALMKRLDMLSLTDPETSLTVEQTLANIDTQIQAWHDQASANIQNNTPVNIDQELALADNFEASRAGIVSLNSMIAQYAHDETEYLNQSTQSNKQITIICLAIEWVLILSMGYLLIRYFGRSFNKTLYKTTLVASGDLQPAPEKKYRKDELGQLLQAVDTMIGRMRGLVGQINDNTQAVAASAVELSTGAKESAASANHVAAHIQEVTEQAEVQTNIAEESSRAVEEMAVGVQRIAESTNVIADAANVASEQAEEGNTHMHSLRQQMDSIFEGIQSLSRTVAQLTEKSEQIGQITENITSFANQTNILSLNASIEAARAGEHGRGFAVVAQEIRKLASGSLESAEVISSLIEETRSEISKASGYMNSTLSQSDAGQAMLNEVEEDFSEILQAVKQVAVQVHETSAITEQMSASSEEVAASMEQSATAAREVAGKTQEVSAATEEQLALAENISHASEQLRTIVDSLKQSVSQFKL
ncbi:methyl-accepting chemotaxis protein [Cohnella lubricantis]|uniref:Methyl-accepting chemotaxis protein n=1 Tax=Cohnella lubricantis TaxID=2163172 RepID=A0A841TAV6_9BACL|nr:methyl-accepting chemotaxis protein [Cohnella lubricantis]MBB6676528.1 methyl-accepting chemotaxis protein [Cohnella lubricantis]MBP2120520.1 methyl-accepting chemotaxis protein [Cohnella lubricantis]